MRHTAWALVLILLIAAPASAQDEELTVEWIFNDDGENATRMPRHAWFGDSLLLLDETRPEAERTLEWVRPGSGKRVPAVDAGAALTSLEQLVGKAAIPKALPWPLDVDSSGGHALYLVADDLFLLDLAASRFARLTHSQAEEEIASLSPDGRKVAFVHANDLYAIDLESGTETRLTTDGSDTILNGVVSWVYWEEIMKRGYWWSPDSQAIAFLRSDDSPVSEMLWIDHAPAVPKVIRQRYPKAGGANPIVTLKVADLSSGSTVTADRQEMPYEYILQVTWRPDSSCLAVQVTERMQTRLDLYLVERATGSADRILSDPDPAWVNIHELQFLSDGSFVWSSERDGHTHLYFYEADGSLRTRLTQGDWSVRGPGSFYSQALGSAFVDEETGLVYFTALEASPVERQLYRVGLDGSGFQRLSAEAGLHRVSFRDDRHYWVDQYEATCVPPSLSLHSADGEQVALLAASRSNLVEAFDWHCPELLTVPADDGHPLQVRLIKPQPFDPEKQYPAIVYIYAGPAAPVVRDSWSYSFARNAPFDQLLARSGYVVMNVDPRSATAASKTIESRVAGKVWADDELADMLAGVRWLKEHDWVDGKRVGVWGWSGGGTSTLLLMTRSEEFKAGISIAPVSDWSYYDTKFAETFMKTPAANPEGYESFSLVTRAKDLHGRLMLVHGTYDDNVHPQNTWAMVDALILAGKRFDMMIYPMRKHGISDRPARIDLFNRMLEFWRRNL